MKTSRQDAAAAKVTAWNHIRAVLLLPLMNTVIIPSALLVAFGGSPLGKVSLATDIVAAALALVLLAGGLGLVVRSITLFVRRGRGTLAPWDPTRVLITGDLYRFSRNPMKAGLFLVLLGESVLFRSPAVMAWAACFIVANVVYIRVSEEKGLRARFGSAYDDYCRQVPRWLRLLPRRRTIAPGAERLS